MMILGMGLTDNHQIITSSKPYTIWGCDEMMTEESSEKKEKSKGYFLNLLNLIVSNIRVRHTRYYYNEILL